MKSHSAEKLASSRPDRPRRASKISEITYVRRGRSGREATSFRLEALFNRLLDQLYWNPGWEPTPADEFSELLATKLASPNWVVDGNYCDYRAQIWDIATAVVWLNYPFRRTFSRLLLRTLKRSLCREEICGGNREALFTKESILWWAITSDPKNRRAYRRAFDVEYRHLARFEFRRPVETDAFAGNLSSEYHR